MGEATVIHGPTFSEVAALGHSSTLHGLASSMPDEWSEVIGGIHTAYAEAGADIITATWGAQAGRVPGIDIPESVQATTITQVARVGATIAYNYGRRIIASTGPLGDCYGDAEKAFISPSSQGAIDIQRRFFSQLAEADVSDVLLETFPNRRELDLALAAARDIGVRVIGISVYAMQDGGGTLRLPDSWGKPNGERLSTIAGQYSDASVAPDLEFFGANCIDPDIAARTTEVIVHAVEGVRVGIWPNSRAVPLDPTSNEALARPGPRTRGDRLAFASVIQACMDAGATVVGGCCGTDPKDVSVFKTLPRKAFAGCASPPVSSPLDDH